ncbi:hypothetical protein ACHAWX_004807 [Stephanocyclus meneghinianus]
MFYQLFRSSPNGHDDDNSVQTTVSLSLENIIEQFDDSIPGVIEKLPQGTDIAVLKRRMRELGWTQKTSDGEVESIVISKAVQDKVSLTQDDGGGARLFSSAIDYHDKIEFSSQQVKLLFESLPHVSYQHILVKLLLERKYPGVIDCALLFQVTEHVNLTAYLEYREEQQHVKVHMANGFQIPHKDFNGILLYDEDSSHGYFTTKKPPSFNQRGLDPDGATTPEMSLDQIPGRRLRLPHKEPDGNITRKKTSFKEVVEIIEESHEVKAGATEESTSRYNQFRMDSARELAVDMDHNAKNSHAYINYSHVGTQVENINKKKEQYIKRPDPPELIQDDDVETMNLQCLRETSLPRRVNLMQEFPCVSPLNDVKTLIDLTTPSDDGDGNDVADRSSEVERSSTIAMSNNAGRKLKKKSSTILKAPCMRQLVKELLKDKDVGLVEKSVYSPWPPTLGKDEKERTVALKGVARNYPFKHWEHWYCYDKQLPSVLQKRDFVVGVFPPPKETHQKWPLISKVCGENPDVFPSDQFWECYINALPTLLSTLLEEIEPSTQGKTMVNIMKTQSRLTNKKRPQAIHEINRRLLAKVASRMAVMLTFNSQLFPPALSTPYFNDKLVKAVHQAYYHNLASVLELIYENVHNPSLLFDRLMLGQDLDTVLRRDRGNFMGKGVYPCFTNSSRHMLPNEFVALLPLYIGQVSVKEVDAHSKEKHGHVDRFIHGSHNFELKIASLDDGCDFSTTAVQRIRQLVVETGLNKVGFPIYAEGENLIKKLQEEEEQNNGKLGGGKKYQLNDKSKGRNGSAACNEYGELTGGVIGLMRDLEISSVQEFHHSNRSHKNCITVRTADDHQYLSRVGCNEGGDSTLYNILSCKNYKSPNGESKISKPVGLENLGRTCYLNCILQCLAQNLYAHQTLLSWKPTKPTAGSVGMNDLASSLRDILPIIKGGQETICDTNAVCTALRLDTEEDYDLQEVFSMLLNKMKDSNSQASLHWIFDGSYLYTTKCAQCGYTSQESHGFTYHSLFFRPDHKSVPTVQDLLDYSMESESIDRVCPGCKKDAGCQKITKFTKLPSVLQMKLFRYGFDRRRIHSTKMYNEVLLSRTLEASLEGENVKKEYLLCAVQNHRGGVNGGHYIAEVMDWTSGIWFNCDDSIVTMVDGPEYTQDHKVPVRSNKKIRGSLQAYCLHYVEKLEFTTQVKQSLRNPRNQN